MVAQKPRKKRWQRRILTGIFTFVLLAALLTAYAFSNLNPILIDMARARARQLAMEAINEAVSEVMGRQMTYSDLVNVLRDESGKVSMLQANTMLMNELMYPLRRSVSLVPGALPRTSTPATAPFWQITAVHPVFAFLSV